MIVSDVQTDSVELDGTLAFDDLLRTYCLQCFQRTWWIILPVMLVSLVPVLVTPVVVLLTSDWEVARKATPFFLLLIIWALLATTPYRGAKRLLKTNVNLCAPIKYTFSSRGINSIGTYFSSELSYEALWTVRETKSLFLLYTSAGTGIVLPKRYFKDEAQQNDWRALVEQGISPKHITNSGFLGRWL
jgi:hypothetical protein